MTDLLVRRDGWVCDRASRETLAYVHRVEGRGWCLEASGQGPFFHARSRKAALALYVEHLMRPTWPSVGTAVTRTTTSGGKNRQPVLWEGTVTKHLRTKARVHWTRRNGQRTSAVLDHYPHEIQAGD